MKAKWIIPVISLLLILPAKAGARDQYDTLERIIVYEKIDELQVDIEIGIADLTIGQAKENNLLEADIRYNVRRGEPKISFRKSGKVGYLTIESGDKRKDCDEDRDKMSDENWELLFTPKVPTRFDIEIGLVDSEIDLSGLKVIGFEISGGLSDINLVFNEPNKEEIDEMSIEIGLGEFTGRKLANANFHQLKLENGLGEVSLDLSGEWRIPEVELNLEVGLGSARVEIPEAIGIEVYKGDNFLSSVDLDRSIQKVRKGVYRTPNWDDAKCRVSIDAEVGLGSIKVKVVD